MLKFRSGFLSITGNFRENNEDSCVIDPDGRYFIVADGMGGQSAGEKASAIAVELIPQKLDQLVDFESAEKEAVCRGIDQSVEHANSEIMALSEIEPQYRNMGTTVVFLVCVAGRFYIGGVGDSRAYQLRGSDLSQLTTDHSLTQALLEAGTINADEAENHRYRNVLYRYLGSKEGSSGTESCEIEPESNDRFLLCSDGVTDGISDEQIQQLLADGDDPQQIAEAIVAAAQKGGSRDNITSLVVIVDQG